MEPTNEERVEQSQLERKRWNWTGVAVLGGALIVLTAVWGNTAAPAVVGVVLVAFGLYMRGKATDGLRRLQARQHDRAGVSLPPVF